MFRLLCVLRFLEPDTHYRSYSFFSPLYALLFPLKCGPLSQWMLLKTSIWSSLDHCSTCDFKMSMAQEKVTSVLIIFFVAKHAVVTFLFITEFFSSLCLLALPWLSTSSNLETESKINCLGYVMKTRDYMTDSKYSSLLKHQRPAMSMAAMSLWLPYLRFEVHKCVECLCMTLDASLVIEASPHRKLYDS